MKTNIKLKKLLEQTINQDNLSEILKTILKEDLYLAFNGNHLLELEAGTKIYIPLFTSKQELKEMEYTRLDKVKIMTVVEDIYSMGKYYAITINPYTDDFIIGKSMIKLMSII